MPNTLNAVNLIAAESLRVFTNSLYFAKNMNKAYQDKFNLKCEGFRTGPAIRIPKPARRTVRSGWSRSAQDFTEESVTLTIDQVRGDDMDIPEAELALLVDAPEQNMPRFSKRFLEPRMVSLANEVDRFLFARCYATVANSVGIPGQVINSTGVFGDAMQKLDESLCPETNRVVIINPAARNKTADALKSLGLQKRSEDAVARAYLGSLSDFDVFMSQNVPMHQVGPLGGTPLVNGASQVGANLVTDGWTAAAALRLRVGDVFTIQGVNSVNYSTKVNTGQLCQFVVTGDVSSNGSGQATIPIFPSIITSGATQTVTASPADNAPITVIGSTNQFSSQCLAMHTDAFAVAFAELSSPDTTVTSATKNYDGFSMRYMRGYNIDTPSMVDRIDVFFGSVPLYPEWSCRMWGA